MDKDGKTPMLVTAAEADLVQTIRGIIQGKLTIQITNRQPDHLVEGIQTRKFNKTF